MKNFDWNQAWQDARQRKTHDHSSRSHWNKRAPSFAQHTRSSNYSREFLRLLNPQSEWTILDVGCGAGTLAIPLAPLVRRVTAIDFSENMIALLNGSCTEQGLANIATGVVGWEDDWDKAGVIEHDVAIASRSLVVADLKKAIIKLTAKARQRVYLSSLVGDGPFDRKIFNAIGRELDRGPDYIYVYNLLYQMGIHADITFINNGDGGKVYANIDDAVAKFIWMIEGISVEETQLLREHLTKHLMKAVGGWTLSYRHPVRWAVISWNTQP